MRYIFLFLFLVSTILSAKTLVFGVFSYRPADKIIDEYKLIAAHIEQEINQTIVIKPLSQHELEKQLSEGLIDIVATNPTHFLSLKKQRKTTGIIATIVKGSDEVNTTYLGGVIITSMRRSDIRTLQDLKGKSIAIPGKKFLGGYLTQVYELKKNNIDIYNDTQTKIFNTHTEVVKAVLRAEADVGFIRTGILEEMIENNQLNAKELFVINERKYSYFPMRISTQLYPEWAVVASQKLDSALISKIAIALYKYKNSKKGNNNIHSFTISGDYDQIDALARELRIAPYDVIPSFTYRDILHKYQMLIVSIIIIFVFFALLLILLMKKNKQLHRHRKDYKELQKLSHIGHWELNHVNNNLEWSDEVFTIFEVDQKTFIPTSEAFFSMIFQEDVATVKSAFEDSINNKTDYEINHRLIMNDGRIKQVVERGNTKYDASGKPLLTQGTIQDITDEKETQKQLKKEKSFSRSLLNHANSVIAVIDRDGVMVDINHYGEQFLQYSKEEIKKEAYFWSRFLPLEVQGKVIGIMESAKNGNIIKRFQNAWRSKSGEVRHFDWSNGLIRDDNGEMQYLVTIGTDITKEKEIQEKLFKHQKQLALSADIAGLVFWELDLQTNIYTFNDLYYNYLATTAEVEGGYTMESQHFMDTFIPMEEHQAIVDAIAEGHTKNSDYSGELEHSIKRRDGKVLYVLVHYVAVYEDGKLLKAYGSDYDLTRQKERQAELEKALNNAKKSELKFHTIFESSLDGIVLIDLKTQKFIEYNSMAHNMYGYTKEEFSNVLTTDLEVMEDLEAIKKRQVEIMKNGWHRFETIHKAKNGLHMNISVTVVSIVVDDESYLYGTFHDITKIKESAQELEIAKENAEKANKAKSEF